MRSQVIVSSWFWEPLYAWRFPSSLKKPILLRIAFFSNMLQSGVFLVELNKK